MHNARIEKSPRLQRVVELLADGREYSTREIIAHADICAVNSAVSELRVNGKKIRCRREGGAWYYKMEPSQ